MQYKGFYIWYSRAANDWVIQAGYEVIGRRKSPGSARRLIDRTLAETDAAIQAIAS